MPAPPIASTMGGLLLIDHTQPACSQDKQHQ